MYKDITGIILSGGKSTRMGDNKSLLKIGELTIIERVRILMKSLFDEVILITNDPADYKFLLDKLSLTEQKKVLINNCGIIQPR